MNSYNRIFYFSYPQSCFGAPHQSMAAIHLIKEGYILDFFCWGHGEPLPGLGAERYHEIKKTSVYSAIKLLLTLFKELLFTKKYDVVYVQGAQQTPFLFWLPLLKKRYRIIYHTQDFLEPRRHRFYEFFERWFARNASYVISNEINRARFMKSYYGLKHVPAVVPTYLPLWWQVPVRNIRLRNELLDEAGIVDRDNAVIIFAGGAYRKDRMSPQLVDAFARMPENYVLLFNGPSMLEGKAGRIACEHKAHALDCSRRILFRGNLSFSDLLELYTAGDVGVLLYPDDGVGHFYQCPGRFTEYLRCGLTLLIPNYPGLELITLKHHLGVSCDPETFESIASALSDAESLVREGAYARLRTLTEAKFVYETSSDLLNQIVGGTYEYRSPSVET